MDLKTEVGNLIGKIAKNHSGLRDYEDYELEEMLAIFKKWALQIVGKTDYYNDWHPETFKQFIEGYNKAKTEIKQRIEESTK